MDLGADGSDIPADDRRSNVPVVGDSDTPADDRWSMDLVGLVGSDRGVFGHEFHHMVDT